MLAIRLSGVRRKARMASQTPTVMRAHGSIGAEFVTSARRNRLIEPTSAMLTHGSNGDRARIAPPILKMKYSVRAGARKCPGK
jgi:hypothetical protein